MKFFSGFQSTGSPAASFYGKLREKIAEIGPEDLVFRLAWGSGWRGMTGERLEGQNLDAVRRQETLGKIMCPKCKADKPKKSKTSWGSYECRQCGTMIQAEQLDYFPVFPKTRRLAMQNGIPCVPLGWVLARPVENSRFVSLAMQDAALAAPLIGTGVSSTTSADVLSGETSSPPAPLTMPDTMPEPPRTQNSEPIRESWTNATIVCLAQTHTLKAASEANNATFVGKSASECFEQLPQKLHKSVFEKRKSAQVPVEVEFIGGKQYRLIRVLDVVE
jgi:hypothetical protein